MIPGDDLLSTPEKGTESALGFVYVIPSLHRLRPKGEIYRVQLNARPGEIHSDM